MIVTVSAARGAPGATSFALLLAAAWPQDLATERVVLEADAAGGVLGARYGLGVNPGVVTLLAALRRPSVQRIDVGTHGRAVAPGVVVVPGPETATQARAIWGADLRSSISQIARDDRVWVVDGGRVDDSSPFVEHSVVSLLVAGPYVEDLVQVPDNVQRVRPPSGWVGVVLAGRTPHDDGELLRFARADAVWRTGAGSDLFDEAGRTLFGQRGRRSWVWRQAVEVAAGVADLVHGKRSPSRRHFARTVAP